jgi:hypothetical protein
MSNNTILLTGSERDAYIAKHFKPDTVVPETLMIEETITDMQQRVSELFDIDSVSKIDTIIQELEGYGIDTEENLDDAFSGCYRDESTFCEDMLCDIYSEQIEAMPVFLQTAIDWEMVWHQSMQYDYFAIYHDCEYYFFNRNF